MLQYIIHNFHHTRKLLVEAKPKSRLLWSSLFFTSSSSSSLLLIVPYSVLSFCCIQIDQAGIKNKKMWITILVLVLLFIAGLISINFPAKKFLEWFHTFYVKIRNNSSQSASDYQTVPDKKVEKRSAFNNNKVQLRSVFATFDKNNDGYITKQELRESLKNIGIVMTENDIADMVRKVDSNGDGLIDLDEFCESFDSLLSRGEMNEGQQGRDGDDEDQEEVDREEELKEAFAVFDGDKDGLITVEELGLVLSSLGFKEGKKLEDCKEMIRKVDIDGDGMVNFDEFKRMMKAGQRLVPVS